MGRETNLRKALLVSSMGLLVASPAGAESKHGPSSLYPSYTGRVMAGYQGWFRAEGDESGQGWSHFGSDGRFDAAHVTIDLWPDVSEYETTYPTAFRKPDGTVAQVFSSYDASTVDLHFRWMQEYGVDGVFLQRFFERTRTPERRKATRKILGEALQASQKYGRAMAVMYDLSGLRASGEDCSSVIQDWKELVDAMKITNQGPDQTYLYHRGKPLVAIWGLGFPDRPYDIRKIGIDRLLDFLKNDPEYGGCSVMLGVPAYFRDLAIDARPDPYLHEVLRMADVVMPWNPQRYTPLLHAEKERFAAKVREDLAWCRAQGLDYAPCVYPGFSWFNLSREEFGGVHSLNQIPRQKGKFYWDLIAGAVGAEAEMLYVAMFDEVDEATAIFKCDLNPPVEEGEVRFLAFEEGVPNDHYLWLTGQAGRLLRGEIDLEAEPYLRLDPATRDQN
ncbi:MAG: glycoside hydrolase family 71/99-like protein [Verrucomicrobiota bacterium]